VHEFRLTLDSANCWDQNLDWATAESKWKQIAHTIRRGHL